MQKKLNIIFFISIICLFLFSVSCYASTDYSVYDESTSQYTIEFPATMVEELGLPFSSVPYYSDSEDIYFFIKKLSTGAYYFYFSDVSFVDLINSSSTTACSITRSNGDSSNLFYLRFDPDSLTWGSKTDEYASYTSIHSTDIVVSSDDIYNTSTGELKVPKTVYTSDNEEGGDSGDSGNTGDTENGENTENEEIKESQLGLTIVSNRYNKTYIEDCLNAGQSPFEALKIMIDDINKNYPDVLSFSSSDIPEYALFFNVNGWYAELDENRRLYL